MSEKENKTTMAMSRDERIQKMYEAKQIRIARQIALESAVTLVQNTNLAYVDKVEEVKRLSKMFYDWISGGDFPDTKTEMDIVVKRLEALEEKIQNIEDIKKEVAQDVIEWLKSRKKDKGEGAKKSISDW